MGSLTAGTVTGGTIQTAASGARVVLGTDGIKVYDASNQRGELNNDGSGWFGDNSNFAWTTGGTLTINATLVDSVAASIIGGWRYQATNYMDGGDIQANSVTATQINVTNLAAINADMGSITAGSMSVARLTTGTMTSAAITLAVSGGDAKIQAGKSDFGDTTAGFILGIDDSDGDKAKLEIGNATHSMSWNGTTLAIVGNISVGSAYTGNSIAVAYTDAKATDANADQTSANTAQDAAAYTGSSIAVAYTDAKATDANADQTSANTSADAAAYTGGSIAVAYTDAKATDANADQTSANNQNLGWITGTAGTLTIESSGKVVINVADALEIGGSGNINCLAGGDISFTPSDTNPSLIKWSTTYNLGAAATATRGICFWPTVADSGHFRVGFDPVNNTQSAFAQILMVAEENLSLLTYHDANDYSEIVLPAAADASYIQLRSKSAAFENIFYLKSNGSAYLTGGLHIGGVADAGANNLIVDGISTMSDYITCAGGIHVGGAANPGANNLIVDGVASVIGYMYALGGVHVGGNSDPGDDILLVDGYTVAVGGIKIGSAADPGASNLVVAGQAGINAAISAATCLKTEGADAQSSIYIGGTFDTYSDAATNYGAMGRAFGGGGTNNYGVYADASGGGTLNHHFRDSDNNYSADGEGWVEGSHASLKALIREIDSNDIDNLYSSLGNLNMKSFRKKSLIPITGYSETETYIDETGDKKPLPILDIPEKAPERFGLISDDPDLPIFLQTRDKLGLSLGKLSNYALICIKHQKQIIEDLTTRVELLEAA